MYKNLSKQLVAVHIVLILVILALLTASIGHVTDQSFLNTVHPIEQASVSVDGEKAQKVTLPYTLKNLDPCTPVSVRATFRANPSDSLCIKTANALTTVFLDDKEIHTFGKKENYPKFMQDPATEIRVIDTNGTGDFITLRMDCYSPKSLDQMTIYPPVLGNDKLLIFNMFHANALPLILSTVQIVSGLAFFIIALCITILDKKGLLFFWMGLVSFTTGLWGFGENFFTSMALKNPTMIYLVTFIGFLTFMIPLIHLTRSLIDFENNRIFYSLEIFFCITATLCLLLQFLGIVSLTTSSYLVHLLILPTLILISFLTLREYLNNQNLLAKRFFPILAVFSVLSILEFVYHWMPSSYPASFILQLGVTFLLLFLGVFVGIVIKDSLTLTEKNKELAFQKRLLDIQLEEEKERGLLLARKEHALRQQRHDLRHQLTAIQALANKDNQPLQNYLQDLMDHIPKSEEYFCENRTVNAIITHYAAICNSRGIDLSIDLVVPSATQKISDSEICVIFGNLLENAVEACERMKDGDRFIRLKSVLQYDLLTITMDNSFNGEVSTEGNRYHSSKRDDYGVGLESIRSVATKAGGDVEFRSDHKVFYSSVYIQL